MELIERLAIVCMVGGFIVGGATLYIGVAAVAIVLWLTL